MGQADIKADREILGLFTVNTASSGPSGLPLLPPLKTVPVSGIVSLFTCAVLLGNKRVKLFTFSSITLHQTLQLIFLDEAKLLQKIYLYY